MTDVHVDLSDLEWMRRGECLDANPNLFFPIASRTSAKDTEQAKAICAACEVRADCLDYAMRNEKFGIWGGTTEDDRRGLRRKRSLRRRAA